MVLSARLSLCFGTRCVSPRALGASHRVVSAAAAALGSLGLRGSVSGKKSARAVAFDEIRATPAKCQHEAA